MYHPRVRARVAHPYSIPLTSSVHTRDQLRYSGKILFGSASHDCYTPITMRRTLLATLLVIVPSIAFALEYDDLTDRYTDAPFSKAETAGVSVLTEVGAISGNPDGSFAPQRTLNRAEFVKIALLAANRNPQDTTGCFPDTPAAAWFSSYVCTAKSLGVVQGNPDGFFHPERPVNYAEALKILAELYDYELPEPPSNERWAWYRQYLKAAQDREVALPASVDPAHELSRGEMARLAAAFVAEEEGELQLYRAFEAGQSFSSLSSSTSSSMSSSSSSQSSTSSLSSSLSSSSTISLIFPAQSSFLLAGMTTPVLYDGLVQATEEVKMQSVEIELFREIRSLEALFLFDQNGKQIAQLSLQSYNNTSKTKWRADFSTGSYIFPGNTPLRVGVVARMKSRSNGASSNELMEIKILQLFTVGTQNNISQQIVPTDIHRPSHQTAFGRMTSVKNTLASAISVQQGTQREIGKFTLTAQLASGSSLRAQSVLFELQSTDVSVSNLKIGMESAILQSDCATEQIDGRAFITCLIPESLQGMSPTPVTLSVFANFTVAAAKQSGTVRLVSPGTGAIGTPSVVYWTDGSGNFNWMETGLPADSGPLVTVTK